MNPDSLSDSASYEKWPVSFSGRDIDTLARKWWQRHPNDPRLRLGKGIVADSVSSLEEILDRSLVELHKPDERATTDLVASLPNAWRSSIQGWATNSPEWAVIWPPSFRKYFAARTWKVAFCASSSTRAYGGRTSCQRHSPIIVSRSPAAFRSVRW